MSKNCYQCKRPFEEYYKLKDGSIICYDCYKKAKEYMALSYQNFLVEKRNIEKDINIVEAELKNKQSNPEYVRYMIDDNNKTRPSICDDISLLYDKRNELEKQLKYARNNLPDEFANNINSAVFFSEKEENKSKKLNDETVNNKDFEKELIERMEDFENKITSRIDKFEKKILKLVEELKK